MMDYRLYTVQEVPTATADIRPLTDDRLLLRVVPQSALCQAVPASHLITKIASPHLERTDRVPV